MEYKTFKDLEFKPHKLLPGIRAYMKFDNGYGISVVQGPTFYCNANTYEAAVMKNRHCCYDTGITDDLLGYQTSEQITEVMRKIQDLPPVAQNSNK